MPESASWTRLVSPEYAFCWRSVRTWTSRLTKNTATARIGIGSTAQNVSVGEIAIMNVSAATMAAAARAMYISAGPT